MSDVDSDDEEKTKDFNTMEKELKNKTFDSRGLIKN